MTMRNWLPALCAAVLALGTGCGKECVDTFDCVNDKGSAPEGQYYVCAENKCELRTFETPAPTDGGEGTDGGDTTDAGTDGGETADAGTDGGTTGTDGGALTCTPACTAPQECDTTTGTCVACATDAHCAGLDATKPYCLADKTACVQCRDNAGCGLGQQCNATNTCEALPGPTGADATAQIAAFRAKAEGVIDPVQAINGAYVTYLKPAIPNPAPAGSSDVVGFFLQAEPEGPAMFVSVDPATLTPALKVGDRVSLTVGRSTILSRSTPTTAGGLKAASDVASVTVLSSGHPVKNLSDATPAGLAVNRSTVVTDLQANVGNYESELVSISGSLATSPASSGVEHVAFNINATGAGVTQLRVAAVLAQQLDLAQTCTFTLKAGPVWRFNNNAQPSAYFREDFSAISCPAPKLVSAFASSLTQVRVTFDRAIDAASITNAGEQFTLTGGLTAQSATVSGRDVLVTTSAQTAGTEYSVSVAATVKDTLGAAVTTPNTATFKGYRQPAMLLLNEVRPTAAGNADLVELLVVGAGNTNGVVLQQDVNSPAVLATLPDVDVAQGDIIVVHITPPATMTESETTAKNQFPTSAVATNYDTAWDFRGNAANITYSSRILLVKDPSGNILDAVSFTTGTSPPGAFPGNLQAIQAAGQWSPVDCGGAPCTLTSTPTAQDVSASWAGLPAQNAPAGSNTVQRLPNADPTKLDTNTKADWVVQGPSLGSANVAPAAP